MDYIVIGAGIAGASVAAELSRTSGRVLLLEAEKQAGYHSTGRSAALFSEMYGNHTIRCLTRASRATFWNPEPALSESGLIKPRGALFVANAEQLQRLHSFAALPDVAVQTTLLSAAEARALCPILNQEYLAAGLYEPDAKDIEVNGLHQGYLRTLKGRGGRLITEHRVNALLYTGSHWRVTAGGENFEAPVVINAAGAWADEVASMAGVDPIGLTPFRRTAVLVDAPLDFDIGTWPLVIDIDENFYFKPDAGLLLISPADETLSEPCDVQPDEWDIAVAIDRAGAAAEIDVRRIRHKWAGLRNFVADRTPVVGFDPAAEGFFWLAGQGGYGVQTAPAMAQLASALAKGQQVPSELAEFGVVSDALNPARLRNTNTLAII